MTIGGQYKFKDIDAREWRKFAADQGISFDLLADRILDMCRALPDTMREVGRGIKAGGIKHPVIGRLVDAIANRVEKCEAAVRTNRVA